MLIANRLLPARAATSSTIAFGQAQEFLTEVTIRDGSSLIGEEIGMLPLSACRACVSGP
jgi:hypothetical protein